MSFLTTLICWLFLTCDATPVVIHHIPAPVSTEFTIESVKVGAISMQPKPKPVHKTVKVGGTLTPQVLTEVPDTVQVYDHDFYIANFTDPSRNSVVIHMNISKADYDAGKYPYRPDLNWTNNETRQLMKTVLTTLNDGEYSIIAGTPLLVDSTTTVGQKISLPTQAYRVKEAGLQEQVVTDLSAVNLAI